MATSYRGRSLKKRMVTDGVGQVHVASALGVDQPLLSALLSEKVPMPRGWSTKVAAAITQIQEQGTHYPRCGCRKGADNGDRSRYSAAVASEEGKPSSATGVA